ncbi:hypothetical protein GCM10011371_19740 [Novosphingobium marinum]|uniref:Putative caspase-like protein n=1 Tax=Novosphingobium marinum TaxID=1514948 RepID=A0A7Y9XWZ5_9SPHN|nr:caspase family protein [Novosphingobium marinum]NYH96087.1 putative caspase-like protein [Novosphingobium marinum]GGC32360.1 hypothetical protein GCM10011371_19740 [Novosphingobium marinum]
MSVFARSGPLGPTYRLMVLAGLALVVALLISAPANARRAALIIGNSAYANTSYLPNPVADAKLMATSAAKAGFKVTLVENLTKDNFDQTLRDFRSQADGAEVAMIYYAGHGMESAGRNWVLPVDASLMESRDLRFEAIELDGLLETLAGAQYRIVVLDACRNNPFGSNWQSAVRSVPRGLAETEVEGALVLFAAASGQVATDGLGDNSPFARALSERLPEPGLSIHRLGSVVREDVLNETGGKQTPWTNMSIGGQEFFLVNPPQSAAQQQGNASSAAAGLADAYAWKYADAKNTVEDYQDYLNRFPNGVFAKIANERIVQLSGSQSSTSVAAAAPAPTPAPSPAPKAVTPPPMAAAPAPKPLPESTAMVQPKPAPAAGPAPSSQAGPSFPGNDEDPNSLAFISASANTVHDRAALPQMPATPKFPAEGYPSCREDFQAVPDSLGRVVKINECLSALASYYENKMNGFARSMVGHQEAITNLYNQQVAGQQRFSPQSQQKFYKEMMAEHAASNPDGVHFSDYREAKKKYEEDRAYLQDRYCANTGSCGGYLVPAGVGK